MEGLQAVLSSADWAGSGGDGGGGGGGVTEQELWAAVLCLQIIVALCNA